MAGEGEWAHGADEEGDGREDGDFDEDAGAGGCSEGEELGEAGALEEARCGAESVLVEAVKAVDGDGHERGEVQARDGGGEAGAVDAEGRDLDWAPVVAVDQEPVDGGVDEVGRDERPGDGLDVVEGLQVAAEDEGEKRAAGCPS